MTWRVTIADNFHYMDASEYTPGGDFDTYEAALARARAIVNDSLREQWQAGMSADDLMAGYCQFGDDPFIVPAGEPAFSARDYARSQAADICAERERYAAGWLPSRDMP